MITDEEKNEPKPAFNERYGEWMREMREELAMSQENVAAAAGIELTDLIAIEKGKIIELYDAIRLCKFFRVED